ncbi:MAG TPA: LrgB family protein [Aliidongia sp.]|nr:LrgB family protein [Aliidongia sp.]
MNSFGRIWVYLETTPLLGLASTLIAYQLALWISARLRNPSYANPVLIAILLLGGLLLATGTPYAAYFEGAKFVHFLLGPATVALAIPMHANLTRMRRAAPAILLAILAGSIVASASAMVIAKLLGASPDIVLSLAPKSVTTPIAMGVAERLGGNPSLAAVFVLLTGLIGTALMAGIMRLARITDWRARGLAAGTAAHAMATARILQQNETAGAFGGLAIGVNGIFTALTVPVLFGLMTALF